MANNIIEIDASGSHKHWVARGDNSVKNGKTADEIMCLCFGSISLYFCVSIHIQTRKGEKYLLDERGLLLAAEILDPSRLTFQSWSQQSTNYDKDPPQMM